MKEPRWKDAFGRVPDSFSARVEGTLNEMNRMEGRQTMKRKIAWRAALAAVLALAILTGTALALGQGGGLIDFFRRSTAIPPRADAANDVAHNVAAAENDLCRLTVREAAYDGLAVRVVMALEAVQPDEILYSDFQSGGEEPMGDAGETETEYAQRVGKRLVNVDFCDIDVEGLPGSGTGAETREGETLIVYREMLVNQPDAAAETLTVTAYAGDGDDRLAVTFPVTRVSGTETAYRASETGTCPLTVRRAARTDSAFATYFAITWTVEPGAGTPLNAEDTYYITSGGRCAHRKPQCGGMENAAAVSGAEAAAQGKIACPVCGSDALNAEDTYYITSGGRCAHRKPQCGGMENAAAVSGAEAAAQGKIACPVCGSDALNAEDTYYITSGGRCAHRKPQCGGMENATAVTGAEAAAQGKIACPVCGSDVEALENPSNPQAWRFESRAFADAESFGSGDFLEDGTLAYTQRWLFQPGAFPKGEIAVTPVAPSGETYPEIHLIP